MAMLCIFLLLLIYGCYVIWQSEQIFHSASAKGFSIYRPAAEDDGMSFAVLQDINSDVFAWLTIYGTNIDYPVTHTDNNETYVNTNALGEFATAGSLFLDCNNALNFSGFNNIIYGHHMEKNAMFGELERFIDPEFLASHSYGNLYFEGSDHGLELIAFLEVDSYDYSVYRPNIPKGGEVEYFSHLISKSIHSTTPKLNPEDRIILLSTCTTTSTNGRHIVVGRITDTTYEDPYYEEKAVPTTVVKTVEAQDSQSFTLFSKRVLWIPCILIILIILYAICARKRKGDYETDRKKKK